MLLLDNSAWARLNSPHLEPARRDWVVSQIEAGELAVCLPFLLEAGYSARSGADHHDLLSRLQALPRVPIDGDVERRALDAQSDLARAGHHRVAPSDLIIAACADRIGAGVLHYDHDFDVIAQRSALRIHSEWLAPAGAL